MQILPTIDSAHRFGGLFLHGGSKMQCQLPNMKERASFLEEATANDYLLFFEHDLSIECGTVSLGERGYHLKNAGNLSDFVK